MENPLLNPFGDDELRQAALVRAALQGNKIKSALAQNPGKVIVAPRQSGKTKALIEYMIERHPEGVILFCANHHLVAQFRDRIGPRFWKDWWVCSPQGSSIYPDIRGKDLPIFADELFMVDPAMQEKIVEHPRFQGAVGTPLNGLPSKAVWGRCVFVK